MLPDQSDEAARTIRNVVKIGCLVNICLMILKLCAGHFGHSEALSADGFHSLNDVAADLIMLIFVGLSFKKADSRYTYGYGKFETLSTMLMSVFLLCISLMIAMEGVESIVSFFKGGELDQPDLWTVVVVLFAMACKEGLYRFYSATGKRVRSKALVANAWHHRSDAMASVATLIGVTFAHFFGPSFRVLDPVASCVIAVFIFIPAVRMVIPAFLELMEHSLPKEEIARARKVVEETPGVLGVEAMRCRRNGHHYLFDVTVDVAPDQTVTECAVIADNVETRLKEAFCPHIIFSMTTRPATKG